MSGPSIDDDAFFKDLPPPPEGWDWMRSKSTSSAEWDALPKELQSRLRDYRNARYNRWVEIRGADDAAAQRAAMLQARRLDLIPRPDGRTRAQQKAARAEEAGRDFLTPDELAVVDRYGLPKEQVGTPLFEIAEVMHRREYEARWDEFSQKLTAILSETIGRWVMEGMVNTELRKEDEDFERRFKPMYEDRMHGGVVSRWALVDFEREELEGTQAKDLREVFREVLKMTKEVERGELTLEEAKITVPRGINVDLCLMIDEGVVSSLLDQRQDQRPYIIGILSDISLDDDEDEDEDEDEDDDGETPDDSEVVQFKIALDSLVDLWRQCQVQEVKDLVPPAGKIYISPGVWEDDPCPLVPSLDA
ncbi:hypothetical protein DL546_000541 [Coniochaeta pulveracea]|uniref:Uncharacterized protein n=1 Tax=Coniochaeta pulveracea TaxID=177199 RepID=A0A420Y5B8_9PEZI|nr:hypothetical protein DL546_000541 [Coniochaeta pulveracea]